MKHTCLFYIAFQVLNIHLIKTCKIEPPDLLFLAVFNSFYISRYRFLQIFVIIFVIITNNMWFLPQILFSTDSLNPNSPQPLNGQNALSVMKLFFQYSLRLSDINVCRNFLTTSENNFSHIIHQPWLVYYFVSLWSFVNQHTASPGSFGFAIKCI